ncbi:hypothetical protein [Frigidibacter mobilis]|uniref:Uncharacterized protein n=1 Tax=Frigidibacter mobilis TaxID=1335048 RepID=A0A159Z635_9RHOB|nr:hypothetical protein [Frigidibacter mobilis]AMY69918.1 hypothetical protein AKL17_2679 [Frigidibacter mobilis]
MFAKRIATTCLAAVPVMALAEPAEVTAASGSGLPGPMSLPSCC